jgi:hypothetical protein
MFVLLGIPLPFADRLQHTACILERNVGNLRRWSASRIHRHIPGKPRDRRRKVFRRVPNVAPLDGPSTRKCQHKCALEPHNEL